MERLQRRKFLKRTTLSAAGLSAGALALAQRKVVGAPSATVNVAVVGVHGRGRRLAEGFAELPNARVVALADVDANVLEPVAASVKGIQQHKPRTLRDFRNLLDDSDVDAMVFAVPDHWHALATILACQAGKDVYVEKPASHNLRDGRLMVNAARKFGRVVQHGTQSRSRAHIRQAIAALRQGIIGDVLMAKAINNQLRDDIGHAADEAHPPPGVDYDLWLGPAPSRKFNRNRFHYNWHWSWDYGTGDIGNDGVHQIDICRWGLDVADPLSINSSGGKFYFHDDQQTPDTQIVFYEFEGKSLVYEMRLWSRYHYVSKRSSSCNIFFGTKGYMTLDYTGWEAYGLRDKPIQAVTASDELDPPHLANFVECVNSRTPEKLNAEIEQGHLSSRLAHLGNISHRVGRRIAFDAATESIPNDHEADALLGSKHREGYTIPTSVP